MKKIRIFGPIEAGALESLYSFFETVQTPTGFPCCLCGTPFEDGDSGVVLPRGKAAHKTCYLTEGVKSFRHRKTKHT